MSAQPRVLYSNVYPSLLVYLNWERLAVCVYQVGVGIWKSIPRESNLHLAASHRLCGECASWLYSCDICYRYSSVWTTVTTSYRRPLSSLFVSPPDCSIRLTGCRLLGLCQPLARHLYLSPHIWDLSFLWWFFFCPWSISFPTTLLHTPSNPILPFFLMAAKYSAVCALYFLHLSLFHTYIFPYFSTWGLFQ